MSQTRSEILYNQILQRIVRSVKTDVDERFLPVITNGGNWGMDIQMVLDVLLTKWTSNPFKELANQLAENFVVTALKGIDKRQRRSFGIDVLQNSPGMRSVMQAATIQNANLIKSIPQQYLNNVANTVLSNMRIGLLPREIAKQLEADYGITKRRAKFIARDQTAKVNGELTKQRQIDAGFEFFKWLDAGDERVRESHSKIAKMDVGFGPGVFRWDDLPTNERGEKIQPGSDYQCRCGSRPVRNSVVAKYQEEARKKKEAEKKAK